MTRYLAVPICLLAALALAVGCGEDMSVEKAVDQGVEQVAQRAARAVEHVKQKANLAGQMDLDLNPPVQVKACYASLVVVGTDRPAVLQVRSYPDPQAELFPSVLIRAPVQVASAAELVGTTISAQVFVQPSEDGPVWHSRGPDFVQVRIDEAADGAFKGTFVGGQLVSTETGEAMDVTGSFSGSLQ